MPLRLRHATPYRVLVGIRLLPSPFSWPPFLSLLVLLMLADRGKGQESAKIPRNGLQPSTSTAQAENPWTGHSSAFALSKQTKARESYEDIAWDPASSPEKRNGQGNGVRLASLEDQGKSIPDEAQEPGDAAARSLENLSEETEGMRPPPGMPPGTRPGMFQSVHFNSTWLPALSGNELGVTDLSLYARFGVPAPTRESPLLITPGFESHHFAGPEGADLPEELYDAYVQFTYIRKLTDRWGVIMGVTPGVHSDFKQSDGDSIRIPGNLLATWQYTERLKLIVGAVYLDRPDISVLPAFGMVWTPREEVKFDLAVPRPRISWLFHQRGDVQNWAYVGGEFGGGSWAVRRDNGRSDTLGYSAYHLLLGWERKRLLGLGSQVEFGYAFGRELEYDSDGSGFSPDGTILLRANVSY